MKDLGQPIKFRNAKVLLPRSPKLARITRAACRYAELLKALRVA